MVAAAIATARIFVVKTPGPSTDPTAGPPSSDPPDPPPSGYPPDPPPGTSVVES